MSATLQTMRSGGSQHPEEIMNFHTSRIVKGVGGIFDSVAGSFLVSEEAVPAMSVLVAEGYAFIRKASDDMVYPVRLYDGDKSVAISSNSSGNTRIDAIVLYVDLGASANADITNVAKIVVVEGTPSVTPSAPSNGDIETAIGASNPYLRLADVAVENGETAILDADIADQRSEVLFVSNGTPTSDGDVANKKYVDDAVEAGDDIVGLTEKTTPVDADTFKIWDSVAGAFKKLSFLNLKLTVMSALNPIGTIREFNVATNPATLLGFGTWSAFGTGRVTVAIDAGDTDFDTVEETGGSKTVTLTSTQIPTHSHSMRVHWHDSAGTSNTLQAGATAITVGSASGQLAVDRAGSNTGTAGLGGSHTNLQPYIVVYRWVRTA